MDGFLTFRLILQSQSINLLTSRTENNPALVDERGRHHFGTRRFSADATVRASFLKKSITRIGRDSLARCLRSREWQLLAIQNRWQTKSRLCRLPTRASARLSVENPGRIYPRMSRDWGEMQLYLDETKNKVVLSIKAKSGFIVARIQ